MKRIFVAVAALGFAPALGIVTSSQVIAAAGHLRDQWNRTRRHLERHGVDGNDTVNGGPGLDHYQADPGDFYRFAEVRALHPRMSDASGSPGAMTGPAAWSRASDVGRSCGGVMSTG